MPNTSVSFYAGRDGARLAYRELGEGRPLVLLHGAIGDGTMWTRHGQAETFAGHGYRVILPDFRGHGSSDKPQGADAYPGDILTDDALALLEHLGLEEPEAKTETDSLHTPAAYDLGGYSLGARIVVRMLVRGATPGRAVVAGQGLQQVLGFGGGVGEMLRRIVTATEPFEPGSQDERTAAWLKAGEEDPVALLHAVESVVATPVEDLSRVQVPTLVAMGTEDARAESYEALIAALPNAAGARMPGNHGSAAAAPELVTAMVEFLTAQR
ncbi:alpha/beta hydrolase fold protein [Catenulispora acidiphila DSM 44928]|uniref:Alpha/beta hydrolase fold protein n=1 Tax=Catenulispora acidiphila (strain DSM 44928 / JCM 14897 / NBRC 102108 / NRRL B-24433 / ID139908) TaxID=479433 RepID=C7QAZ0_CATAD|nr:alpha/beta hydrolase [Catenulispora acidiphila]ACU74463.1 alpha/beta hydrolase fold protein [Catenulispora acidiphila DSM 44928]